MEDKIFEYCCVFFKIVNRMPEREWMENFVKLIAEKNYVELTRRLQPGNKASRMIFQFETGIKLAPTACATQKAIQEYCGENYRKYQQELAEYGRRAQSDKEFRKLQEEAELDAELDGFMRGESNLRRKSALRYLTEKRYLFDDKSSYCIRDYIRHLVELNNCFPHKGKDGNGKPVYVIKSWTVYEVKTTAGYRYDDDCEIVDDKHIRIRAGGFHVAKTGYDYAIHMVNRKAE